MQTAYGTLSGSQRQPPQSLHMFCITNRSLVIKSQTKTGMPESALFWLPSAEKRTAPRQEANLPARGAKRFFKHRYIFCQHPAAPIQNAPDLHGSDIGYHISARDGCPADLLQGRACSIDHIVEIKVDRQERCLPDGPTALQTPPYKRPKRRRVFHSPAKFRRSGQNSAGPPAYPAALRVHASAGSWKNHWGRSQTH